MKNDRFIIESNGIWDKEKGEEQLTWRELCNLLNELYIENKQLNEIIRVICDIDLYGENESVKELIEQEIRVLDSCTLDYVNAWNDYEQNFILQPTKELGFLYLNYLSKAIFNINNEIEYNLEELNNIIIVKFHKI